MVRYYSPSSSSRFIALLVGLPAVGLCLWVSMKALSDAPMLVAGLFALLGMGLAIQVLFSLTLRVAMDAHSITRTWLLGRTVVPVDAIHRLSWGGSRGTLILTIHYGAKRFIQLSSHAIARPSLREIHDAVLAARGLEGVPLQPPFAEYVGYVDIDDMIKAKG